MYMIHEKTKYPSSFDRLLMLWEKYPQYHEAATFTTLDEILAEHESYQKDFTDELRNEYEANGYDKFLIQLSWADLPYRYATKSLVENPCVSMTLLACLQQATQIVQFQA